MSHDGSTARQRPEGFEVTNGPPVHEDDGVAWETVPALGAAACEAAGRSAISPTSKADKREHEAACRTPKFAGSMDATVRVLPRQFKRQTTANMLYN